MDINSAWPSSWLKAVDLKGQEVTVIMEGCELEEVGQGADAEQLPVLRFQGQAKALILNKTNGRSIEKLYGSETLGWPGRPITLFPTTTQYGSEVRDCIRIKAPATTPAPVVPPEPPPPQPPAPEPPATGSFF
tara:strand:- start:10420 stop:10818 length:399 start_codon:yes stop_codon:yes gene_type:complete